MSDHQAITDTETQAVTDGRPKARSGPKWEKAAVDRVKVGIRKFSKPLADLAARDANEGDTRLLVTDFLCDVLGFDKYADLTTEYRVRGEFADFGLRVDKQLAAFVEVKRVTTKLGMKHLRQVQNYALNEGVEWVVLTNGAQWQVYHITAALPVLTEIAFDVDLLADGSLPDKAAKLFYLTSESMKRRRIDELWQARRATSPESLAKVLRSEKVVDAIRKELWRQTEHRASAEDIVDLLEQTVLRPECLGG